MTSSIKCNTQTRMEIQRTSTAFSTGNRALKCCPHTVHTYKVWFITSSIQCKFFGIGKGHLCNIKSSDACCLYGKNIPTGCKLILYVIFAQFKLWSPDVKVLTVNHYITLSLSLYSCWIKCMILLCRFYPDRLKSKPHSCSPLGETSLYVNIFLVPNTFQHLPV